MLHQTLTLPTFLTTVVGELMELNMVYDCLVKNASTEEARRMMEMNRMTVHHTKKKMDQLYLEMCEEEIPPQYLEALEKPCQLIDFASAIPNAFKEELQLINWFKELYLIAPTCYRDAFFAAMVDHGNNAMRLLCLSG